MLSLRRITTLGVLLVVSEYFVQKVEAASMGGQDETWWVLRRRCEVEVLALAATATKMGTQEIEEWQRRQQDGLCDRGRVRGVDRKAYSALGKNMQFVSGVQEVIFTMIQTTRK